MTKDRTVQALAALGEDYLAEYCAPKNGYAWPAYDVDYCPHDLVPTDILAPAFLSYPIKGKYVQQIFKTPSRGTAASPYARLLEAMLAVIEDADAKSRCFEDLDEEELDDRDAPGWGKVLRAIDEVQNCSGLTSVAVTKILHRKRPLLVPINDSRLRDFYCLRTSGYRPFFNQVHQDVGKNVDLLDRWRQPYDIQPPMTRLRCLDIVVWMHEGR